MAKQQFEVIEYPGLVQNVDKMLATLGGIQKISQAFSGDQKHLELRYHPKNPYNKAAYAECSPHPGFLIKVRVRRSKREPTRPPKVEHEILGHCSRSFTFENLCDFQYLPLSRTTGPSHDQVPPAGLHFDINSLVPRSITDIDYFNNRPNVPLFCLPHQFARSDIVHREILRCADLQDGGQHDVLGLVARASMDNCNNVVFSMTDALPTRPHPKIMKRMKLKLVTDEQFNHIKKLFEECPVWTRVALLHESGISANKLKCLIPSVAYYFCTGPWRTLYARYGYDPRKDFHSRHYQTFDFRLRFRSGVVDFVSSRRETVKRMNENPPELLELQQGINYPYFEENKLPRSRQCIMRYCDLHLPKIQEMLDKIPSPLTGAMCNERNGWLPAGFSDQVRQIVSGAIKELLHNHYRKEQIQAEVDALENANQEDEPYGEEDEEGDGEFEDDDELAAQAESVPDEDEEMDELLLSQSQDEDETKTH